MIFNGKKVFDEGRAAPAHRADLGAVALDRLPWPSTNVYAAPGTMKVVPTGIGQGVMGAVSPKAAFSQASGGSYVLKLYIFWGMLGLVLIGIGVTLMRQRSPRRKGQATAVVPSATALSPSIPAATPPEAAFDPKATRIYFRTSPSGPSSASPRSNEAMLSITGSAKLVCVGGPRKGKSFPITVAGITAGRDPKNDIVIVDPRISHRHAWVGIIDRKAVLRDLGSTNGTFLNAKMDSRVAEVVLSPGDTVFFGGHGGEQFCLVVD